MPSADSTETNTIETALAEDEVAKVDLSLLDGWKGDDNQPLIASHPVTELEKLTSREAFQSRLRTFLPLTYFCKPASLSPIVCARFGWINTSVDLIKCSTCKAALVIKIHPKITERSTIVKLVKAYQTKLATAHKSTCPFRFEAEMHLVPNKNRKDPTRRNTLTVPPQFASILPEDVWEMLEMVPMPLVRARLQTLLDVLVAAEECPLDGEPPKWQLPKIDLPEEFLEYGIIEKDNDPKQRRMLSKLAFDPHRPYSTTIVLEQETLLTKLEHILVPPQSHDEEIRAQTRTMEAWEDLLEGATALALLGWEPEGNMKSSSSGPCVSLKCTICLSHLKFNLQKYDSHHQPHANNESSNEEEPPSKRRRTNDNNKSSNPLMSHRQHCPYVCGFPRDGERKTTPIWKVVAGKLLKNNQKAVQAKEAVADGNKEEAEQDGEAAIDRILHLLQSGVSSRVRKSGKAGLLA